MNKKVVEEVALRVTKGCEICKLTPNISVNCALGKALSILSTE